MIANALAATIMPPFEKPANASMPRSIVPASRTLIARTSTPNDGATDWITANWPMPAIMVGSHNIAEFVTFGAICFRSSSHFPLRLYSNCKKPVALPPGRERLSTNPEPTGSGTFPNTTGIVLVAWSNDPTLAPPVATITSGARVTSSAANLRAFVDVAAAPTVVDPHVAAINPTQLLQGLHKRGKGRLALWIVFS